MSVQYLLELSGTCFFSISGALLANQKSSPDWFGVTIIGLITALGGGSIRDILLGAYPLIWVKDINFIAVAFGGIVLASVFYTPFMKVKKRFQLFETLGIAFFTILGTQKALGLGIHPLVASIMGMFSAVMGGVLRDVLTNEIPVLFRKEIYATACFAGAIVYVLLLYILPDIVALLLSIAVISAIRFTAIRYELALPKFRNNKVDQL